jgi:DNA-binding CsgD family transcriptional regulator
MVPRPAEGLVYSGAELVAYSWRFRRVMFVTGLVILGSASAAALVLLPFRAYPRGSGSSILAVSAAGLLLLATPVAILRAGQLQRALTRSTGLQLLGVLLAAALVATIRPLNSELWWPSCAILMVLATIVPAPRVLVYCLIPPAANLLAHVGVDDLRTAAPVSIIGLWVGYPFWTALFALVTDRLIARLMQRNLREPTTPPPLRVVASSPSTPGPGPSARAEHAPRPSAAATDESPLDRLTARQLEVIALLADGLRYREVAACLTISERQVERHVANAQERLGAANVNQLIAIALAAGLAGDRTTRAA